eukprot:g3459.t1
MFQQILSLPDNGRKKDPCSVAYALGYMAGSKQRQRNEKKDDVLRLEPVVFGTMEYVGDPTKESDAMIEVTSTAISTGYRCFDMAELYTSTRDVARSVRESGIERRNIFLVSKIKGMPIGAYADVRERVKRMLEASGTTYFDALMIHWPGPSDIDLGGSPAKIANVCDIETFEANVLDAWQNMLRLREDGYCRYVGVSNFYERHIATMKRVLAKAGLEKELPFANAIYIDAAHQRTDFVRSMQKDGIRVMAYRTQAFLGAYEMIADAGCAIGAELDALAKTSGAISKYQFVVAALVRRGIHVINKSSSKAHQITNLDAIRLAATLTDATMKTFADLEKKYRATVDMYGLCDEYAAAFEGSS